jgi:hypothetical protein
MNFIIRVTPTPKKTNKNGKHIQFKPAFLQGSKKTRSNLQPDTINKEYQSKLFHKMESMYIHSESEMAECDANEEYPGDTKRYPGNFNF